MVDLFGKKISSSDLMKQVGSLKQVAGIQPFTYSEGRASKLKAAEVRTGGGLRFVVLPGRGMDIGQCEFKGIPLAFRSAAGETSPEFYEPQGEEWLRSFGGGLLVTCGLTQVGSPCEDQGETLGQHGRISNIPAENISINREWEKEKCTFKISGEVREAKTLSTNMALYREISARLGENRFFIRDRVKNEAFEKSPLMLLYHFNLGFPLLDEKTELFTDSKFIKPRDKEAQKRLDNYKLYKKPAPNYPDIVFDHKLKADEEGWCTAALINHRLDLGFYLRFQKKNLPNFIQWKFTGEGNYVTGMEPANCLTEGRKKERKRGTLVELEPGEEKEFIIEAGVLSSKEEISSIIEDLK